ncbi:hypothetical protein [uncultured Acetobacterium sp.]|uniref:hypothetical protein n=1 Tax=uncultured Acetobacterium sp. TaxID=217139 RepID=UPI0025E5CBEE|nr:hypothetical protein [uncultured Acetobacterium sp.]
MNKTDFLFARPSLLRGFGRAIDLRSTRNIYNNSDSGMMADHKALKSDWSMVGGDIKEALKNYNGREKK